MFCVDSDWGLSHFWEQMLERGKKKMLHFVTVVLALSSICSFLTICQDCVTRLDSICFFPPTAILMSSPGHEIIIPRTRLLCPHSEIVCIRKQRTCYLIRCLDRWFFTFMCLYHYMYVITRLRCWKEGDVAGLLSLYVSFTVYHELALEDSWN